MNTNDTELSIIIIEYKKQQFQNFIEGEFFFINDGLETLFATSKLKNGDIHMNVKQLGIVAYLTWNWDSMYQV